MRLVSFLADGRPMAGALIDGVVAPLAEGTGAMRGLLEMPPSHLAERAERAPAIPLRQVRLQPPVPCPGKIICIGLNYARHAAEGGNPIPDYPALFLRAASSLIGPDEPMLRPRVSERLDWEAELAVVIGRRARHVREEEALAHVAGYACFNDGSVRDYQRRSSQWGAGKNFDATGAFGPWIVTADALPPGAAGLSIRALLNGEVMQDGDTSDMIFPVARLVSLLSEVMTLEPGDVIATGTPAGVGYARTPPRFLAPGDVIEVEIEGIGRLRNPIAAEP